MSTDPYHLLQSEIQATLQTASTLHASYIRIRRMTPANGKGKEGEGEESKWARNELKATLTALEADLEDLEESVRVVESRDARFFGLDDKEVLERRQYVNRVRGEVSSMRAELEVPDTSERRLSPGGWERGRDEQREEDHQSAWAREEQQMMIRQQDSTLDSIQGTLTTLAQQAGLMGMEIGEHNELLGDLEAGVDQSDGKLSSAMRRMRKFVRETEETKSGWCIIILVVILMVLLLAVILI